MLILERTIAAAGLESPLTEHYSNTIEPSGELTNEMVQISKDEPSDPQKHRAVPLPVTEDSRGEAPRYSSVRSGQHNWESHPGTQQANFDDAAAHTGTYQSMSRAQHHPNTSRRTEMNVTNGANEPVNVGWPTAEPMPPSCVRLSTEGIENHRTTQGSVSSYEIHSAPSINNISQRYNFSHQPTYYHGIGALPSPSRLQYNTSQLGNELPLPSSYSHYETSFARRLIRATIEEGYRLLMNPGANPADLRRLSTFAFCFMKAPRLRKYFQEVMARTARENMELWSVPMYHVGDAGFHYPRVGIDASSEPPPWWANRGFIGPRPISQPEIPVPPGIVDILEYSGVDGEWFDSNDVAEYLRGKGLNLDMYTSMVQISDSSEPVLQTSYPNTQPTFHAGHWTQAPSTMPNMSALESNSRPMGTSVSGPQTFAHLDWPSLPEPLLNWPTTTRKLLDVESFVRGKLQGCIFSSFEPLMTATQYSPKPLHALAALFALGEQLLILL